MWEVMEGACGHLAPAHLLGAGEPVVIVPEELPAEP